MATRAVASLDGERPNAAAKRDDVAGVEVELEIAVGLGQQEAHVVCLDTKTAVQ